MAGSDNRQDIKVLLEKISSGKYTPEEEQTAKYWLLNLEQESSTDLDDATLSALSDAMWRNVAQRTIGNNKTRPMWPRIAAAASVIIALTLGGYFLLKVPNGTSNQHIAHVDNLSPVQKGVLLTLGNGKIIRIDQLQKGEARNADGTTIKRSGDAINYTNASDAPGAVHTLTNQSASMFNITLTDGTEATLDVASSLTYPVGFNGNERRVKVIGQVYFKVRHNIAKPFFVETKDEVIEDVGTEFNIDAYADDLNSHTTLVKGAIKVSDLNNTTVIGLKPGEQVTLTNAKFIVNSADLEAATAWMQGKLVFNHESLESILKKVSRIYDVKVVWQQNELRHIKIVGVVSRTRNLASILNFFRKTGAVDFIVNGKTITVTRLKTITK